MKRKRVGAGQRGWSLPFQAAKELLKPSTCGPGSAEMNSVAPPPMTCSIRARATAISASINSPTKEGRGVSKKKQKLAEAAKTSHNISQYFTKKQTTEKLEEEGLAPAPFHTSDCDETSNQPSRPAAEAVEISPTWSESGGVGEEESKEDVIVISDDVEEEKTTVEPESTTE